MSAAALKRPGTRTSSVCATPETARVTHSFKVIGSVLHNGFGAGRSIRSAIFAVGGHRWCIQYYPDGLDLPDDHVDYVAVFLELLSRNHEARAAYEFRLVNRTNGVSTLVSKGHMVFNDASPAWGNPKIMKKSDLRASGFLKHNCLEIECDVTVISKAAEIDVPLPDILDSLGKLLGSEEGADITFKVQGEAFRAHKIVLAMRSPVFKAEFYGPAKDNRKRTVVVEGIEPAVFKALLHFVYTDSLPAMDNLDSDKYEEMVKHLLVAAQRYGMERIKLICESILCKKLCVEGVADTLVLADQNNCIKLKYACIGFIGSSNRMDDVAASEGYKNLKRACPALTVELWEKSAKYPKI